MSTTTRHPLVAAYLDDLRREAQRLPRRQRAELVAEITAHLDEGMTLAQSEAEVRNLLDDLGTPQEIVAAAAPSQVTTGRPYGRTALILGVVALAIGLIPLVGLVVAVPLGIAAIIVGIKERREARSAGASTSMATGGVVTGAIAIVVPLLFVFAAMGALIVSSDSVESGEGTAVDVEVYDEATEPGAPR